MTLVASDSVAVNFEVEVEDDELFQNWPGAGSKHAIYNGISLEFTDGFDEFGFGIDLSTLNGRAKGDKLDDENVPPRRYDPDTDEVILSNLSSNWHFS